MFNRFSVTILYVIAFFLSFALLFPEHMRAQENRALQDVPDEEKRSSIHEVDGYGYLSENMTTAQVRQAALATAKRQALEMAQTYIKSKTLVEDFETKYDLIWASAEGAVTVLEQKDLGIEDNSRYHVWIKAEVKYDLKPIKPNVAGPGTMDPTLPLKVQVWTDRKTYKESESIVIFIKGNRDFYGRVVDINPEGDIVQLFPNDYRKDNLFKAGVVYRIPDGADQFTLRVVPPFGEDRIVVYASEVPQGEVPLEPAGSGLHRYRGLKTDLDTGTRGVTIVSKKAGGPAGADFYEANWIVSTEAP